ncbi:MAG: gp53-like domain-containing protein [Acetobacteraceae bacterium]
MQRVNRSTAVATMPAPPAGGTPGFFTGGNPGAGQPATVPGYEWFNSVQEELIGLILRGGITPSNTDFAQVRKSLDRAYGGVHSYITASTTLTVDQAGLVLVDATAGPRTITLPPANALGTSVPIRYRIMKVDGSSNVVTIALSGSNDLDVNYRQLLTNDVVDLVSNGFNSWLALPFVTPTTTRRGQPRFATTAETDAGTNADVAVTPAGLGIATRNYANPGYARLPGGLILQWGVTNSGDVGANFTATFPIAFPNAVLHLSGTPKGNGGNGAFAIYDFSHTLTTCTFTMNEWAATVQNASVAYLAIGR